MNGQAVGNAPARAAATSEWRTEVAEGLELYSRYGDSPGKTLDDWIRNVQDDIQHKQAELWTQIVELHRLRAYQRQMQP